MINTLDKLAIRFYNWCIITALVCFGSILLAIFILLGFDDTKFTEIIGKVRNYTNDLLNEDNNHDPRL
jgi:hypothetical protein